jgi:glucose/arabinose dehydrogenase
MFVTSQDGNVYLLNDEDKDGRADSQAVYSSGYVFPLGVAVHAPTGDVYVSHQGKITIARDTNGDGRADKKQTFVSGLPFKKHQNDNLEFGPDGFLYMGLGSTCDACEDSHGYSATILRINIDTRGIEVYASGLRNPYDIAFHPETGELFATDNGRDDLGLDGPFEELNHIIQGGDYGYPGCWNEQDAPGCENTTHAVAFFEAHSSANGVDFYNGESFPSQYRGNAFVSIFGIGLKSAQTGIQRVVLSPVPDGDTYRGKASWFVRFPAGVTPLPLLFGPDDALYVGDYLGGAIYRISYGLP